VQCSSHGLERIVTNLVDNAFTHGAPPVEVRLDPVEEEFDDGIEDADWVRLVVEDAGEGMTLDILHEATERFVRAPEARARPGAGLGLSLVEQLVTSAGGELRLCSGGYHTSHGGRAPVECLHGPGTAVTVLLPATDAPPAELRAEAS
jgi:signal transduction histidine kinase